MKTIIVLTLLTLGSAVLAAAAVVPEIDAASGASALALLTGAIVVFRASRRK